MQNFKLSIISQDNTSIILSISIIFLFISCSTSNKNSHPNENIINSSISTPDTLTSKQESAFDALNTLQVNTDEKNRIYSTFPNITQPCYPPDTTFVISQTNLLIAMKEFLSIHCKNLTSKRRNELAEASVQAQNSYNLNFCAENLINLTYKNGPPLKGIWVLPNILGRRDLTLVW